MRLIRLLILEKLFDTRSNCTLSFSYFAIVCQSSYIRKCLTLSVVYKIETAFDTYIIHSLHIINKILTLK